MRTADPANKIFRIFKNKTGKGQAPYRIEGRPKGKRERYYFQTEKEAKKAAADRNIQIAAFGTQNLLGDTERVMAAECLKLLEPYGKTLFSFNARIATGASPARTRTQAYLASVSSNYASTALLGTAPASGRACNLP